MLRLLVAAGGTGGGVYPALAVVGALVASSEAVDVLWIGGEGGMEASLVERAGIAFETIPTAGLHGVGLRAFPGNLMRMARGVRASREVLRSFQPDVLFFTGGYVGVPVAFAGRKRPGAMYVPDLEPALALRWISRWVKSIMVTSADSQTYYAPSDNVIVTGYPTRQALKPMDKTSARQKLGLAPDLATILVFGGSRGARSINEALWKHLPNLLAEMQVIHITGTLDWPRLEQDPSLAQHDGYRPFAYVHEEMAEVFSAADVVVSRAGAAVLGEYPLFGLPAILIPYPHAWRYQWVNAKYLEERGAALIVKDENLAFDLVSAIRTLMADLDKRQRMAVAMRAQHQPYAAEKIAQILLEMGESEEAMRG
jgi:UDP-N-acetylglucosamine--N-acetylmuramyl-(pentapeptide) pyrophosphoryl-undecaprenol N-acetylglucosamine transferase